MSWQEAVQNDPSEFFCLQRFQLQDSWKPMIEPSDSEQQEIRLVTVGTENKRFALSSHVGPYTSPVIRIFKCLCCLQALTVRKICCIYLCIWFILHIHQI